MVSASFIIRAAMRFSKGVNCWKPMNIDLTALAKYGQIKIEEGTPDYIVKDIKDIIGLV